MDDAFLQSLTLLKSACSSSNLRVVKVTVISNRMDIEISALKELKNNKKHCNNIILKLYKFKVSINKSLKTKKLLY